MNIKKRNHILFGKGQGAWAGDFNQVTFEVIFIDSFIKRSRAPFSIFEPWMNSVGLRLVFLSQRQLHDKLCSIGLQTFDLDLSPMGLGDLLADGKA